MGRFFKLPKRCPYCAHRLNKFGQCKNPNCIIGYVPDKRKTMATETETMMATMTTTATTTAEHTDEEVASVEET